MAGLTNIFLPAFPFQPFGACYTLLASEDANQPDMLQGCTSVPARTKHPGYFITITIVCNIVTSLFIFLSYTFSVLSQLSLKHNEHFLLFCNFLQSFQSKGLSPFKIFCKTSQRFFYACHIHLSVKVFSYISLICVVFWTSAILFVYLNWLTVLQTPFLLNF